LIFLVNIKAIAMPLYNLLILRCKLISVRISPRIFALSKGQIARYAGEVKGERRGRKMKYSAVPKAFGR
jgi:hypothetical protein